MIYIYTLTDIYRLSRMGTVLVVNKTSILHLYKVDSTGHRIPPPSYVISNHPYIFNFFSYPINW